MSRTADYTIQDFIYQFIVTFRKILNDNSNADITIEVLSKELKDMELNDLVKKRKILIQKSPIIYESTDYYKSFGPIIPEIIS